MALLNFPPNPVSGQLFPAAPLFGQAQYQWSAADSTWRIVGVATGVGAGTYGNATNVGQFTVDATGRITSAVNVPIAASAPNLQQVTDTGAVTTSTVDVGGLIAAGLTYPTVDGSSGDYLTTDGAGGLNWLSFPAAPNLSTVVAAGNVTANPIEVGGLVVAGIIYPLADGTANQVMATNGDKDLGWISTLKVVAAPSASADPGNLGEVAIGTGFFYFYDGANWLQVAGSTF